MVMAGLLIPIVICVLVVIACIEVPYVGTGSSTQPRSQYQGRHRQVQGRHRAR